jgi:hypothetical protein
MKDNIIDDETISAIKSVLESDDGWETIADAVRISKKPNPIEFCHVVLTKAAHLNKVAPLIYINKINLLLTEPSKK